MKKSVIGSVMAAAGALMVIVMALNIKRGINRRSRNAGTCNL